MDVEFIHFFSLVLVTNNFKKKGGKSTGSDVGWREDRDMIQILVGCFVQ